MPNMGDGGLPDIRDRLATNETAVTALQQAGTITNPADISDYTNALDGAING